MKLYEWEVSRTYPPFWTREGLLLAETPEQARQVLDARIPDQTLTKITIAEIDLAHAEAKVICDEEFQ